MTDGCPGGRGPKRPYPASLEGNEELAGSLPVNIACCQKASGSVHHGDDREGLVQNLKPNGVRQEAFVEPVGGPEGGLRHLSWWGQLLARRALVLLCRLIDHAAAPLCANTVLRSLLFGCPMFRWIRATILVASAAVLHSSFLRQPVGRVLVGTGPGSSIGGAWVVSASFVRVVVDVVAGFLPPRPNCRSASMSWEVGRSSSCSSGSSAAARGHRPPVGHHRRDRTPPCPRRKRGVRPP